MTFFHFFKGGWGGGEESHEESSGWVGGEEDQEQVVVGRMIKMVNMAAIMMRMRHLRRSYCEYLNWRKWREEKSKPRTFSEEGAKSLLANLSPLIVCQNCQVHRISNICSCFFGLPIFKPIWCVLRALVKTARCEDAKMKSTFSANPAAISPKTDRLATSTSTSTPTMNTSKPCEKFCLQRIFIAFSGLSLVRLRNYGSAQCLGAGPWFFLLLSITF